METKWFGEIYLVFYFLKHFSYCCKKGLLWWIERKYLLLSIIDVISDGPSFLSRVSKVGQQVALSNKHNHQKSHLGVESITLFTYIDFWL